MRKNPAQNGALGKFMLNLLMHFDGNYSAISALHNKDLNLSAKKLSKIAEYIPLIPCWSEIFFVPLHL